MRLILPSPAFRFLLAFGSIAAACSNPPPPVQPGPPIGADPPPSLRGMVEECDALTSALASFKECPNLELRDREDLDQWIERAGKDFAAGRKANPEPNAQRAIALACFRATRSVHAATERCLAGPPPKDSWWYEPR
ncbi:MAG: hypothetical protein ACKV2T_27335 [Kofleriaceae bacterium]